MKLVTSPGLVLRRQRHQDHDTRLTLFLRNEGKALITAKGVQQMKSKLRVLQEPFTKADFQVYLPPHGVYGRLIQGKLLDTHQGLRQNIQAFHFACRCCEVVELLFPFRAPSPEAFDILSAALQSLQTNNVQITWVLFILRLLHVLGHGDHSNDIIKLMEPREQKIIMEQLKNTGFEPGPHIFSDSTLSRSLGYIDRQLEWILPQQLRSNELSFR